ncbi:MAG TPA: glucan biosynthesis protein [Pseudolabrys sp.]|nr:glucan biosynthesis protein [Pseudolabrys sp.]
MDRRDFLARAAGAGLALRAGVPRALAREQKPANLEFGPPHPFHYEGLKARAKALAAAPYHAPNPPVPALIHSIDFDTIQKIKFRPAYALWPGGPFPVRMFHLQRYVTMPVKIHVAKEGVAREVIYSARYFDYGGTGVGQKLPPNLGFAGFRVMDGRDAKTDWLAFQGASYFRSCGDENQYGASARGIAIDTATDKPEEFPRFTEFWLAEHAKPEAILIYALLDGPSIAGAYRIEASRSSGVVTDVHTDLFARTDIKRLGIAPLTSMFWYGQNIDRKRPDWRPEVHDSDGLALWTGKGERIWRPLIDPPAVQTNAYVDLNPKGFGLLQRDRKFADYQDDGAFYNKRPSLWVEPRGEWGAGAVQLVEIPTDDEVHDNIVAYWTPQAPVKRADSFAFDYRLCWQSHEPQFPRDIARVIATHIGRGGKPGVWPPPKHSTKFVIDFAGGPLATMAPRYDIKPVVTLSRGEVENPYVIKVVGTSHWRAFFDVNLQGSQPVDMRCYLRLKGDTLSETWLYQFFPPAA